MPHLPDNQADDGVCRSALLSVNTHFFVLNYSDGVDRVCAENQVNSMAIAIGVSFPKEEDLRPY